MAVPYTFGSATTSIPLSQLDSNFATAITLGNTAVQLGNTITNLTGVSNVASSGSLTLGTSGNTTAVTIDTSQNVGIGTASPVTKVDIQSTVGLAYKAKRTSSGVAGGIGAGATTQGLAIFATDFYADTPIIFGVNQTDSSSNPFLGLTERMRINATAPVLCLAGGSTTATGTGIAFPATQSASSDANTLDDYEEGTWTPTFSFSGSSTGITYGYQIGYYTKVGRVVTIQAYVQFTNKGSASGGLQINGLPFTSIPGTGAQGYCSCSIWANALNATVGGLMSFVQPNNTYILPYYSGTGSVTQITNTTCNNNSDFMINATYVTNT